jgi:hypothetical protein
LAAGGEPQAGQFDFLAMLAQAEAQEQLIPTGEIASAEIVTEHGMSGPTVGVTAGLDPAMAMPIRQNEPVQPAGHEGADLAARVLLVGEKPGESGVDLINDPPSGREIAAAQSGPVWPAMAMQQPVGASLLHVSAAAPLGLVLEQPAISTLGLLPWGEASPSDLPIVAVGLTTMARDVVPAAPSSLAVKLPLGDLADTDRPAEAQAFDPHPEVGAHDAPEDPAENTGVTPVVRLEPPLRQSPGQTPTLTAGPLLPEWLGLSMSGDLRLADAGSQPGQLGPGPSSPPAAASLALPYQRLFHSQLSAQVAPAVLTIGLLPGADGGPGRLTLAIRPAELGTLQIIAEKAEDRSARIAVLADRPETLQLLIRDASTLEAALRAAGVGEGAGLSLTFGLSTQGQGDRGGDARGEAGGDAGRSEGDAPNLSVIAPVPVMARTGLVDLSL